MHEEKILGDLEKNADFFLEFSQNENIFVKIGKIFAHFDRNILILRFSLEKNYEIFFRKNPILF